MRAEYVGVVQHPESHPLFFGATAAVAAVAALFLAGVEPLPPIDRALQPEAVAPFDRARHGRAPAPATALFPASPVTGYDADLAGLGANLVVSAHAPRAALLDRDGHTLHEWAYRVEDAWPGRTGHWERAALFADGGLAVLVQDLGLLRLDADSRLVWQLENGAHDDLAVLPGGGLVTLAWGRAGADRQRDGLALVRPDGWQQQLWSFEGLLRSAGIEAERPRAAAVDMLAQGLATDPDLAAGHVLIARADEAQLVAVELGRGAVTWSADLELGPLSDGQLAPMGRAVALHESPHGLRVAEVDLQSGAVLASYPQSERRSLSPEATVQRLVSGHTLVVDGPRAIELSRAGGRVWELVSPHGALRQCVRIPVVPRSLR